MYIAHTGPGNRAGVATPSTRIATDLRVGIGGFRSSPTPPPAGCALGFLSGLAAAIRIRRPPHIAWVPVSVAELIPAATVLLVRDGPRGPEILMVRRNSKIAFGGMWAFPGGRVDDHELDPDDPIGSAATAAVREVREETILEIERSALRPWSYWIPPGGGPVTDAPGPRRRYSTWFFVATAPSGDVAIDGGEIHDHAWRRPDEALADHRAGEIELVPPTWITLHQLSQFATATAIVEASPEVAPEFATRALSTDPLVLGWAGDAGYETGDLTAQGGRNRLYLQPDRNWVYEQA